MRDTILVSAILQALLDSDDEAVHTVGVSAVLTLERKGLLACASGTMPGGIRDGEGYEATWYYWTLGY